ncbi:MAG: SMC-Scp complex subunit ScpB [Trueperaceae bacterium]|nr:SMC-Scp complex subunit ScpB [Trueperaceae bacterium]
MASGQPVTGKDLRKTLGDIPNERLAEVITDLKQTLAENSLGLIIEEVAGGFRLVVEPSLIPDLSELLSPPPLPRLSSAALETLALIAYKQPVTRGELEAARGASCASTVDTLQERELIKVVGRKDVIGKPLLFATTDKFLIEFGLNSLDDLPPLEDKPAEFLRG